jgi:NADH-quinone oxidoreductase subunit L
MTVALGVSAYSAGIFHLMTHAFFKALLFLAAGSVIIAMHHEQDMRKMGGLFKYMPVTAVTCWIGALALIGTPFFSGFYSKDALIEAVAESHRAGATYAYWCVLLGVFVTALYTFRLLFMTFHGAARWKTAAAHDTHEARPASGAIGHGKQPGPDASAAHEPDTAHHHAIDEHHPPHESPWVVTVPLVALAIPSIVAGYVIGHVLFGDFFGSSIFVLPQNDVLAKVGEEFHGVVAFTLHGLQAAPVWLAAAGVLTAYLFFLRNPRWADIAQERGSWFYRLLTNKYYFDWFNEKVLAPLARGIGFGFWKAGDQGVIDGLIVNGSARTIGWMAGVVRQVQSGYLYHYAFAMIIGLCALLAWLMWRPG